VWQNKLSPNVFLPFSEQPLQILKRNLAHLLPINIHVTPPKNVIVSNCDKVIFSVNTSLILMSTKWWQNETVSIFVLPKNTVIRTSFEQHNKQFVNQCE